MRPVPDDEADAPQLATEDFPEHETDEGAQEQGVRETEARPAAVELHRSSAFSFTPKTVIP